MIINEIRNKQCFIVDRVNKIGIGNAFGDVEIIKLQKEIATLASEIPEGKEECADCYGTGIAHECDCEFCTERAECNKCDGGFINKK